MGGFFGWVKGVSVLGKIFGIATTVMLSGVALSAATNISSVDPTKNEPPLQAPQELKAAPVIQTSRIKEEVPIPYEKATENDPNTTKGTNYIKTAGANGIKTITYDVVITDGKITSKLPISEEVTRTPVAEVTAIGTYVAPVIAPIAAPTGSSSGCDPNYSGCVPIASDVDCEGGSGNGPAYVLGPISVIGNDIYDLDRDDDGIACE